jgi:hypothetical protein
MRTAGLQPIFCRLGGNGRKGNHDGEEKDLHVYNSALAV